MKLIRLLKLFGAIGFVALLSLSFTQSGVNDEDDWTLLKSENGISSYVMQSECGGENLFLFRFENTLDTEIEISYTISVVDDPTFSPITKTISLKGKESKQGTCDDLWTLALPGGDKAKASLTERVNVLINK